MRIIRTALICAFAAASVLSTASAGERQDNQTREKIVRDFCKGSKIPDCKDFRVKWKYWTDATYRNFYKRHLAATADAETARVFGVSANS